MKKIILLFLTIIGMAACNSYKNIDSTQFYDYDGTKISLEDIKSMWNKRLQKNEEIHKNVTEIHIEKIKDETSQESHLILIGNTDSKGTKTDAEITKFKNGYQLSKLTVTCENCGDKLSIKRDN